MEGSKILEFTAVPPSVKQKNKLTSLETQRFDLDLIELTGATCPEFFYSELLKTKSNNINKPKSEDPFGSTDDANKLAAIAKAFEDKYNQSMNGKKKQKWQDNYYFAALGEGYDESDTFIDNSEAYDEILPETLTTKLGGFYINAGALELKEMSDLSDEEFRSPSSIKENKKKRRISSDSDSREEQKKFKKTKMKDTLSVEGQVKKKKKKILLPGEKHFKKPKVLDISKDHKSPSVSALIKSTSPNVNGKPIVNGVLSAGWHDSRESEMESNISMVIDSVVAMATKDDSNGYSGFEEQKKEIDPESIPKLPSNLPSGMEEKITLLTNQAQEYKAGKSGKFFTDDVNNLLQEVEMGSKQMTVSVRSAMYAHLAAFLPCSKDTLLKQAKTLRVKELEDKIKGPLESLREAITLVMPALCQKFEEDCGKVAKERMEVGDKDENKKEETEGKEEGVTESDEEEKSCLTDSFKKRQNGPRKKFVWDNNIRSLLCDVVRVKMHTYQISKARSQTAEEFCKAFLDQDVRPLWPKGWMQTRALYKESRSAHMVWTNCEKRKKGLIATLSAINHGVTSSTSSQVVKAPGLTPEVCNRIAQKNVNDISSVASSVKLPNTSAQKTIPGSVWVKHSPALTLTTGNIPNTQTIQQQKLVSSILDFTSNYLGSTNTPHNSSPNIIKSSPQQSTAGCPVQEMTTVTDTKMQRPTEKSWNHVVSDILCDSITAKAMAKPFVQRQNSNMISTSQGANHFYAQFEKYVAAASEMAVQPIQNQTLPSQSSPKGQIITDHQKMLQEQHLLQQHIEKEKMRQLNLLKENRRIEKEKQFQQVSQYQGTLVQTQSGPKQVQSNNQPKQMLAQHSSLSNNITGVQTSVLPKQRAHPFHQSNTPKMSELTNNVIRQQLGGQVSSMGNSPQQVKLGGQVSSMGNSPQQVKLVSKNTEGQAAVTSENFGNLMSSDILRKTSPQGIDLLKNCRSPTGVSQSHSQSATNRQVLYSTGAMSTDRAANLLKSLFAQSGEQSSSLNSPSKMSISLQGGTLNSRNKPQQRSPVVGQVPTNYLSTSVNLAMPYTVPVTSIRPVPGYQSIKLSNFTGEQMAALQAAQQNRIHTSGNIFSAMSSRQESLATNHHSSEELYKSLQFNYHGFRDKK